MTACKPAVLAEIAAATGSTPARVERMYRLLVEGGFLEERVFQRR